MKTTIENGIKVYGDYWCHCKDKDGNSCGLRIPYPINKQGLANHKHRGIPIFIHAHNSRGENNPFSGKQHTEESLEKMSVAKQGTHPVTEFKKGDCEGSKNNFYGKKHTDKSLEKMSNSHSVENLSDETRNKMSKAKSGKNNSNYGKSRPEHMKMMQHTIRPFGTKIERTIYKYTKKLFPNDEIHSQVIIPTGNKTYIVDFLIPHIKTVIEVNGCYFHYCVDCFPLQEDVFKAQKKRLEDNKKINDLRKFGLKVIVLWEHDIKNKSFKHVLKTLKQQVLQ